MKETIQALLEQLQTIETSIQSNEKEQALTSVESLKSDLNSILEDFNFTPPDLDSMTLEEIETLIFNGFDSPEFFTSCEKLNDQLNREKIQVLEKAFSLLEDVDFRLSEDEDEATIEERMDNIHTEMYIFGQNAGFRYRNGSFWRASFC